MTSVGSILRRKREADGISVEGIAGRLCVTSSYLRAIEADDVKSLPGNFFYRSFAFQYAGILGLDAESLREGIDLVCPREESQAADAPADELVSVAQRSTPTLHLAQRPKFLRGLIGLGAAFAVLAGAGVGFSVWQSQIPQVPAVTEVQAPPAQVIVPDPPAPAAQEAAPIEANQAAALNLAHGK